MIFTTKPLNQNNMKVKEFNKNAKEIFEKKVKPQIKKAKMEQTAVEWYEKEVNSLIEKYEATEISKRDFIIMKHNLFYQAKEMEKDRETRIKELETFLQEDILDDVYYYHSPIWHRATELLNQNKDKDE